MYKLQFLTFILCKNKKVYKVRESPYFYYCLKTSQFKTVCKDDSGYVTQLKQQKSKKVILLSSTSPHSQCADK